MRLSMQVIKSSSLTGLARKVDPPMLLPVGAVSSFLTMADRNTMGCLA